ncbi:YifB family Mg chelatase-like AAA ATPase [Ferrovum sp.]|jgi:magnesium chelatase family protein|uniref:YifB family Mg chelatase-like AAA ATPase n=1 Tax=Ferrovum sp. TaxID=2609467 RepID=UPI00261BC5DA|nr:YifB family Mg chelatase-like AAA ATPase [Ferrovum sp.]
MAFTCVYSRALWGAETPLVRVEVHLSGGLPQFNLVGLPEAEVRESRDRVRAALNHCGFGFPLQRVTVNLAPAELPKHSSRYDLPIAIGILAASHHLPHALLENWEFAGELGLNGGLCAIHGALPMAVAVAQAGHWLMVARASAPEAVHGHPDGVYGATHLREAWDHLTGCSLLPPAHLESQETREVMPDIDLAQIRGQAQAKRVLEIAAGGRHHLLLVGPPGVGKSLLARCLPGICTPMTETEALALAAIRAAHRETVDPILWRIRPFRHPHHSVTTAALMGGGQGTHLHPGEVSLAHGGTLHLDELGEFPTHLLDMLREPLESGQVAVSRAAHKVIYPARFQLVGAMNPCPCGYRGHPAGRCRCTQPQLERYTRRLSGPFLDRIDLQWELPSLTAEELMAESQGESSKIVRQRVISAQERQQERQGMTNESLGSDALHRVAPLSAQARKLLLRAADHYELSVRAVHRVWRVARTIADLGTEESVSESAIAEALHYRTGFRKLDSST